MVIDDLALKGVIEPSSIWTVICMLANGSKNVWEARLARYEAQGYILRTRVRVKIPGSKNGIELDM